MSGGIITVLPFKQAWLAIQDPTQIAQVNWTDLCVVTRHLVAYLWGRVKFRSWDNAQLLWDGHAKIRIQKSHDAGEAMMAVTGGGGSR